MEKHEKIVSYIENLKKNDTSSQKFNKLFIKVCKVLWITSIIAVIFVNLITIFAMQALYLGESALPSVLTHGEIITDIVVRAVLSGFLLVAIILLCKKIHKIATATGLIISLFLIVFRYISIQGTPAAALGEHIERFIWQHVLPLGSLALLSVIIFSIFVSKKRRENAAYKEVEAKLYEKYQETVELSSEESWQNYLKEVNIGKTLRS